MVLKVYLSEPMEKVKRIEMIKNNEVGGPRRKIFPLMDWNIFPPCHWNKTYKMLHKSNYNNFLPYFFQLILLKSEMIIQREPLERNRKHKTKLQKTIHQSGQLSLLNPSHKR